MGAVAIPTRKETPTPKTTPKKKDLKVTIEKVINAPENQS
jgi:hypothetical protein